MSKNPLTIHHADTIRIWGPLGGGWEISCQRCGYRLRFLWGEDHSDQKLEILALGDPLVRHVSYPLVDVSREIRPPAANHDQPSISWGLI